VFRADSLALINFPLKLPFFSPFYSIFLKIHNSSSNYPVMLKFGPRIVLIPTNLWAKFKKYPTPDLEPNIQVGLEWPISSLSFISSYIKEKLFLFVFLFLFLCHYFLLSILFYDLIFGFTLGFWVDTELKRRLVGQATKRRVSDDPVTSGQHVCYIPFILEFWFNSVNEQPLSEQANHRQP